LTNRIETARLLLRPLTLADAGVAYEWVGDPEVGRHVSWLPLHSMEETRAWLEEIAWEAHPATHCALPSPALADNYIWGFVRKDTSELIGSGGLIWEAQAGLFQVGYNIKKSHWNNGFTTEAMRGILAFAAAELGIKRVSGGHAKENLASARVLEKLGFVYDREDITPHVDGTRFFDSREYTLDLMQIAPASRDELHEIAVFLHECWQAEYRGIVRDDFLDTMTVQARHAGLLGWFDAGNKGFLALRCCGRLVGAAVFGQSFTDGFSKDGEISAIYLHHNYIGKGYGRMLFAKTEAALAAQGYRHFVLDVLADNVRAMRFYQKHGYTKVGDAHVQLGDHVYPLVVFRKDANDTKSEGMKNEGNRKF